VGRTAQKRVLVVVARRRTWLHCDGLTRLAHQLGRPLVEEDYGALGVIGAAINLKHVLHAGDELGILLRRDYPGGASMRLRFVF
jgi:hypothetical protein